jgi:uncharacterized RDD family membrane protein YckC
MSLTLKRFLASSIDIAIASFIVLFSLDLTVIEEYFFLIALGMYLLLTSIYLNKNPTQTLGERIMKIEVVYTKWFNKLIVILRNFIFSILIYGAFISGSGLLEIIWMMSIPMLSLIPIINHEKLSVKMNGLDYLFKTYYKEWVQED